VELQRLESEAAMLRAKLGSVAATLQALDESVADSEGGLQEIREQQQVHQKRYRQLETDLQMNQGRIKKSEEKSRSVKNNKEYQSILKEIEDMQTKNSSIEDEMIACLERIETIEQELAAKNAEIAEIRFDIDSEKAGIAQETEKDRQRLAELEKDIETVSARAEPELLRRYRLVKEQTRGIAIAAVSDAVCRGCNLNIPPQMYNELQRCEALTMCPHCQRIIYWEGNS